MTKVHDFLNSEIAKIENRMFWGRILSVSLGYILVTLLLNSIRAKASLWFVWPLIIVQLVLYLSIFIAGYRRSKTLGLNENLAFVVFIILAFLGRVNDWEIVVIPVLVAGMLIWSALKKTPPNALS